MPGACKYLLNSCKAEGARLGMGGVGVGGVLRVVNPRLTGYWDKTLTPGRPSDLWADLGRGEAQLGDSLGGKFCFYPQWNESPFIHFNFNCLLSLSGTPDCWPGRTEPKKQQWPQRLLLGGPQTNEAALRPPTPSQRWQPHRDFISLRFHTQMTSQIFSPESRRNRPK